MHIINSMEQRNNLSEADDVEQVREGRIGFMEERIYKTMSGSGALSITLGIIAIVTGVVSGVLLIVSGAGLLSRKSKLIF